MKIIPAGMENNESDDEILSTGSQEKRETDVDWDVERIAAEKRLIEQKRGRTSFAEIGIKQMTIQNITAQGTTFS